MTAPKPPAMQSRLQRGQRWLARLVRRFLCERCDECLVTRWHMKLAYRDYQRRQAVMVLWPLNFAVTLAWWLNSKWCIHRHRESWIDREVKRRTHYANNAMSHERSELAP
jgi:hypothetical protein